MEKSKKVWSSQPQVRKTTPDETLQRYHVDLFNPATGNAKDALFEEINFKLYKLGAKSIAFTTSEARINSWICCLIERYYKHLNENYEGFHATWEEQEPSCDLDSCDRIIIHLYAKEDDKEHQLVAKTVYISTGTIFIQRRWYQNYGMVEFPFLLDIINKMQESISSDNGNTTLYTSTLSDFLKQASSTGIIEREEEKEAQEDINEKRKKEHEIDHKVDTTITENTTGFHAKMLEPTPCRYTPSRLHTVTTL